MSIITDSYIFIHNPKTAGSAMENIVGGTSHQTLYGYSEKVDLDNYWKWMFVRNPYDRIVSSYVYQLSHEHIWPMTFTEYIKRLDKFFDFSIVNYTHKWMKRPHLIPQHYFCCIDGINRCDFIGRFEHIEKDWKRVCKKIGIEADLHKTNSTHHGHYLEYMTDEIIEIINELYAKDFKLFGYDML